MVSCALLSLLLILLVLSETHCRSLPVYNTDIDALPDSSDTVTALPHHAREYDKSKDTSHASRSNIPDAAEKEFEDQQEPHVVSSEQSIPEHVTFAFKASTSPHKKRVLKADDLNEIRFHRLESGQDIPLHMAVPPIPNGEDSNEVTFKYECTCRMRKVKPVLNNLALKRVKKTPVDGNQYEIPQATFQKDESKNDKQNVPERQNREVKAKMKVPQPQEDGKLISTSHDEKVAPDHKNNNHHEKQISSHRSNVHKEDNTHHYGDHTTQHRINKKITTHRSKWHIWSGLKERHKTTFDPWKRNDKKKHTTRHHRTTGLFESVSAKHPLHGIKSANKEHEHHGERKLHHKNTMATTKGHHVVEKFFSKPRVIPITRSSIPSHTKSRYIPTKANVKELRKYNPHSSTKRKVKESTKVRPHADKVLAVTTAQNSEINDELAN